MVRLQRRCEALRFAERLNHHPRRLPMKRSALILALAVHSIGSISLAEGERIEYDFNFDGHMDYCVCTFENARGSEFDVYIFDPTSARHVKDKALSGTVYPKPDPATKEVRCIWTGGHSGADYSGSVYRWNGSDFEFAYTERQEAISMNGKIRYIRVKAVVVDGRPKITSIEQVRPNWERS